jgi:hypothetical protein
MKGWARSVVGPVAHAIRAHRPDAAVTSLFGVEVLHEAEPPCPWVVVNSTFYIGPDPPRPLELDLGARAVPLIAKYAALLRSPDLILHATDPVFDFSFNGLPETHRYVGPLGVWEPPSAPPAYIDEPGGP